jgi:hypothetical protein
VGFTSDYLLALAVAPVVLAIPTSFLVMLLGVLAQTLIVMLLGQVIVGVVALVLFFATCLGLCRCCG